MQIGPPTWVALGNIAYLIIPLCLISLAGCQDTNLEKESASVDKQYVHTKHNSKHVYNFLERELTKEECISIGFEPFCECWVGKQFFLPCMEDIMHKKIEAYIKSKTRSGD